MPVRAVPDSDPVAPHDDPDADARPVRPTWACVTCPPPKRNAWVQADSKHVTCTPCYDRLRSRLGEVGERYLRLDARPGGTGEYGSRGAPGFGSRSPGSDHVICLRDPRSSRVARTWVGGDGRVHAEQTRPPMSVHGVLSTLSWEVAEHRGVSGPGDRDDVYMLLRFIDRHLDYITRHAELAVDADAVARELLAALKPVTGDARRKIGHCPNTIDEGESSRLCDAPLYAPTAGDVILCRACTREWRAHEWLRLGDLLSVPSTSPALAHAG